MVLTRNYEIDLSRLADGVLETLGYGNISTVYENSLEWCELTMSEKLEVLDAVVARVKERVERGVA